MMNRVIHLFIRLIISNIIYGVVIYVQRNIREVNMWLNQIKVVVIVLGMIAVEQIVIMLIAIVILEILIVILIFDLKCEFEFILN